MFQVIHYHNNDARLEMAELHQGWISFKGKLYGAFMSVRTLINSKLILCEAVEGNPGIYPGPGNHSYVASSPIVAFELLPSGLISPDVRDDNTLQLDFVSNFDFPPSQKKENSELTVTEEPEDENQDLHTESEEESEFNSFEDEDDSQQELSDMEDDLEAEVAFSY